MRKVNQQSSEILQELPQHDNIQILTGHEVLSFLSDKSVASAWESLYQNCAWATVFQSFSYTHTWFQLYSESFQPILVVAKRDTHICGILALARRERYIFGAGHKAAYYQTWLAEEDNKESFIKRALKLIMSCFSSCYLLIEQIAPNTPLSWVENDSYWKEKCDLRQVKRPLINLKHPDLPKLFRKKSFKESRNKLNRHGKVCFYQVESVAEFNEIFDTLAAHFDFRKEVTLRQRPFLDDPYKKRFLMAQFELGLLYVCVLRFNREVIAALVATKGKNNWVHGVGINIHLPFYSVYSPGIISFVLMAQRLAEQGYDVFDLTTGGSMYKEYLANEHDAVFELRIGSIWNPSRRTGRVFKVKEQVKAHLITKGIDIKALKFKLKMKKTFVKDKILLARSIGALTVIKKLFTSRKERLYKVISDGFAREHATCQLGVNNVSDLQLYLQEGTLCSRWEFLQLSMRRFEKGDQAYTLVDANKLKACIWLHNQNPKHREKISKFKVPQEAAVLVGLYIHPDEKQSLHLFLTAVLQKIIENGTHNEVYLISDLNLLADSSLFSLVTV